MLRYEVMLPEVASRLPRAEDEAVDAGVLAGRLSIPEDLAALALVRLVVCGVALWKGQDRRSYWAVDGAEVPNEAVRLVPDKDAEPPRQERARLATPEPPGDAKKIKLADLQTYFKAVHARARVYAGQALDMAEQYAKRNGGGTDKTLVQLRIQYLALEAAMDLVEGHMKRLQAPAPVLPTPPPAKSGGAS